MKGKALFHLMSQRVPEHPEVIEMMKNPKVHGSIYKSISTFPVRKQLNPAQ
jgi:hypothetical protein